MIRTYRPSLMWSNALANITVQSDLRRKSLASLGKHCGDACKNSLVRHKIIHNDKSRSNLDIFMVSGSTSHGPAGEESPLSVSAAGFLDEVLSGGRFADCNMLLDNAVSHTGHPLGTKFKKAQILSCGERLAAHIHTYRPKVIVAFGDIAKVALGIPSVTNLTSVCGEVWRYEFANEDLWDAGHCYLVPCIDPEDVVQNPGLAWKMQIAMQKAGNLVFAEEEYEDDITIEHPHYVSREWWDNVILPECEKLLTAVDLETTGFNPEKDKVLCASVTYRKDEQLQTFWSDGIHMPTLRKWFRRGERIIHNAKFELKWIRPDIKSVFHDTFLRAGFIDENESHKLDDLGIRYAGAWPYWADLPDYVEWKGLMRTQEGFLDQVGMYCGLDTTFTYRLYEEQEEGLTVRNKQFLRKVVNPLTYELLLMEERGMKLDMKRLKSLTKEVDARLEVLDRKLKRTKLFKNIKWSSPKQVAELLYDTMGLPVIERTPAGARSASKEVIEILAEKDPRLKPIVEHRNLTTKMSHVLGPFQELVDGNGYLHSNLNHGFVVTGRLSSSQPNLQNIERGGAEKECLVSRFPRGKLLKFDYGQFELRVAASHAKDRACRRAVRKGIDLHTDTANRLGIDRQTAKAINLSLAGGAGPGSLHHNDGIPKKDATRFHKVWLGEHPDIKKLHDKVQHQVETKFWVENLFGRKRHLPGGRGPDYKDRRRALNQARSMILQGGGADIIAAALVALGKAFRENKFLAMLVLQIHDEIVIDCPASEVEAVTKVTMEIMENPWEEPLYIPMSVDVEVGRTMAKDKPPMKKNMRRRNDFVTAT